MATLYENISKLCAKNGIKGGKMCTDLCISKGLLTDLKMGRRSGVSAVTAQKIADYFGVTVGYLLGTDDAEIKKSPAEPKLSRGEEEVLELFRQIPEDQQPVVLAMIRAALSSGK